MNFNGKRTVRVAILDLYEGVENQGMRGLREILNQFAEINHLDLITTEYDIRLKDEFPGFDHDIYVSSGGPGSPIATEGEPWDNHYMEWIEKMENYNNNPENIDKKYVYFICHSYQLVSRHYRVGQLAPRKSTAFGVFPIHLLEDGENEPVFAGMADPFYAVDSRDYQVIQPDFARIEEMGAKILCIEKERPHVPYERAIMGIRFNDYFIGTQFHPEADAIGMSMYLKREDKKAGVIKNYGLGKWESMIEQLEDPDKILWTYAHIIPNFLKLALNSLKELAAA
ncbi:MAG: GMP synthase [Ginsengibacter sp.]|jgi:GMP synthase-like glutamine amidotransferase